MIKIALERDIPIFGICRGVQLLNMVLGGTIHQHIPHDIKNAIKHNPGFPPGTFSHNVQVEKGTLLHRIVGKDEIAVDSSHHQAVDKPCKGSVISARASDTVIEALEIPSKKFVLGVQWHPERVWRIGEAHRLLFNSFIDACREKK
jgi:putative glutamine amidotransferase